MLSVLWLLILSGKFHNLNFYPLSGHLLHGWGIFCYGAQNARLWAFFCPPRLKIPPSGAHGQLSAQPWAFDGPCHEKRLFLFATGQFAAQSWAFFCPQADLH